MIKIQNYGLDECKIFIQIVSNYFTLVLVYALRFVVLMY